MVTSQTTFATTLISSIQRLVNNVYIKGYMITGNCDKISLSTLELQSGEHGHVADANVLLTHHIHAPW